jgi:hypothetical protein
MNASAFLPRVICLCSLAALSRSIRRNLGRGTGLMAEAPLRPEPNLFRSQLVIVSQEAIDVLLLLRYSPLVPSKG